MTTTYLALTKDAAATDGDRQIILNALFRNSADGIVKDEGGFDPSLAAAIARIGMGAGRRSQKRRLRVKAMTFAIFCKPR